MGMGNESSSPSDPDDRVPDLGPQSEYRQLYRQWRVGSPEAFLVESSLAKKGGSSIGSSMLTPGSPPHVDNVAPGRSRTFTEVQHEDDFIVQSAVSESLGTTHSQSPKPTAVGGSPARNAIHSSAEKNFDQPKGSRDSGRTVGALRSSLSSMEISVKSNDVKEGIAGRSKAKRLSAPPALPNDVNSTEGSLVRTHSQESSTRVSFERVAGQARGQPEYGRSPQVNSPPPLPLVSPPPLPQPSIALSKSLNRQDSGGGQSNSNLSRVPRSISTNDLQDLAKFGYFPAQPKSATTTQRSLKVSVIEDMCRAVAKQMVGDVYIESKEPGTGRVRRVVNHLYQPVYVSVQRHFKQLPARYALSVNPDEVTMHMKLLTELQRAPDNIAVHCKPYRGEDGSVIEGQYDITVCCKDQDNLLDSITRSLKALKGRVLDADVMTTTTSVALDRFAVIGDFAGKERIKELKSEILRRLNASSDLAETPPIREPLRLASLREAVPPSDHHSSQQALQQQHSQESTVFVLANYKKKERPDWEIDFEEIILETVIGTGRSGQTYLAQWRGKRVAAKVVNVVQHGDVGEEILSELYREVEVVSTLRHPNICLFLGAAAKPPTYCLIFEYMEGGTLTNLLRTAKGPLDFFRLALEIAQGMNYLHLCHIIHRDLKSGNLLLDKYGTVKISDFGLSCVFTSENSGEMTAETGTYRWMAPEVIRHEPYSKKADVYSYGVVLWEIVSKEQPFKGMTPIQAAFAVARQNMRPALPSYTPPKVAELIEHCWHGNPAVRPTFAEILEMLPMISKSLKKKESLLMGIRR